MTFVDRAGTYPGSANRDSTLAGAVCMQRMMVVAKDGLMGSDIQL